MAWPTRLSLELFMPSLGSIYVHLPTRRDPGTVTLLPKVGTPYSIHTHFLARFVNRFWGKMEHATSGRSSRFRYVPLETSDRIHSS